MVRAVRTSILQAGGVLIAIVAVAIGCAPTTAEPPRESYIERPTDIALVFKSISEDEYNALSPSVQQCYVKSQDGDKYLRAYGYVPQPPINSVAKLDLCNGVVVDEYWRTNPYVIGHIEVGLYPVEVASLEHWVFVLNAQTNSVSVIDSELDVVVATPIELDEPISHILTTQDGLVWLVLPDSRTLVAYAPESDSDYTKLNETKRIQIPSAESITCTGRYAIDGDEHDLTLEADPVPARPVDVYNDGKVLVLPNLTGRCFLLVDTTSGLVDAYDVAEPTAVAAVSPDSRWIYLGKRWRNAVAVFDLQHLAYIDTNEELPSHEGAAPLPPDIDYDIPTYGVPKGIAFAYLHKDSGIKTHPEEDENAVEYQEAEDPELHLFGFIATTNGRLHTIDLFRDLHEHFDAYLWDDASLEEPHLLKTDENDDGISGGHGGAKLREEGFDFARYRTPDGDWKLIYNGVLPVVGGSVSGRLDFENGRLYDPRVDFRSAPILVPSERNYGDRLVILSPPTGTCSVPLSGDYTFSLEIVEIGYDESANPNDPDYIAFRTEGVPDLSRCFESSIEYEIRANENYLVYFTPNGQETRFLGRAFPKLISEGSKCTKGNIDEPWSFFSDELSFVVCRIVEDPEAGLVPFDGLLPEPAIFEFRFTTVSEIDRQELAGNNFTALIAEPWDDAHIYAVDAGADRVVRIYPPDMSYLNIE